MAFQLSPSVLVTETDLTNIIPAVSTSTCAMVGEFQWGPALEINTVDSVAQLADIFGVTTSARYIDHMVAQSFLSYASNLKVVRVIDSATAKNATTPVSQDSHTA